MEPKIINREILLFTGTGFCSRPFSKRDSDHNSSENYSSMEELEKACWDGMLHEMLPELLDNAEPGNYVWKTISGVNFLCINMGSYSLAIEKQTSIDPYFFLHEAVNAN